jgi:class 3 adenylate cyclase/tetratricopeptide (TPR) repeat protein
MEYRVLGSLEVLDGSGQRVPLGGTRQQTVLGSLLLRAGRTVSLERLVDELWETPPETAAKTVQVYVSRLRRLLSPGAIESRSGGYALRLDGDRLDLTQFERLADEGRSALGAADWERAATLLREALALWRGPALGGLAAEALRREADRLEESRLQVLEDRLDADLARGRARDVVAELQALVAEHPFRERLRGQLMLALYRTGRQTEALEVYRDGRTLLTEELGLEPSEELRRLEQRMLAHDPELAPVPEASPTAAAPAPPAPVASTQEPVRGRRPATVVFADVVDSTTLGELLDPESVHRLLERYSEIAREILERHGGEIEKFIGDAVVAFFGLTELHEDDALRAVRAAVELRQEVRALADELKRSNGIELAVRIGVNSGDIFVGGGAGREIFATGDSVNVAARLEQAADAWDILLGDRTYRLVQVVVRAEPLKPLEVKGRVAPVQAWRLFELAPPEAVIERPTTPFVGRQRELEAVREAFAVARDTRTCRLCTILGPAGIGKTRLGRELLAEVGDAATVAVGRCLSYGEGITYHPLIEIVRQLAGDDPDERIANLMGRGEDSELVARRMRGLVGLSAETAPAEETFWAVRKLFEAAAGERPLIVGFEDLHWAEPLLLDLIEYLTGFSAGTPLLVVCLARPELLERRPSWAVEDRNRSIIALEALSKAEAQELVRALAVGEESLEMARIVRTAEGNPLFLEQLVATEKERGETATLPPSIQAVLAARIAGLDPAERKVLERASVEGRNFRWSSVAALLSESDRDALGQLLMALVRRQLIQPDPSASSVEDAFRFKHALIQEAAYDGLPKEVRADLHERLASRLSALPESEDEIVGFHLEQSYRCRFELGLVGQRERTLAAEAMTRLEAAGHKAFVLGDPAACAHLLGRAASLLPPDDPNRLALLPTLGAALFEAGRLADADGVLTEAIERSTDDELLLARARVEQQFVRLQAEAGGSVAETGNVVDTALHVFERHGDDLGQCRTWCLTALLEWIQGQVAKADEAWSRAAEHARRAHDERELFEILDWRASAAPVGPTPVAEAIERCVEIRDQVQSSPVAVAQMLHPLASLHAMRGELDVARSLGREANAILDELGRMYTVAVAHHEASVELLAGQPALAEECLRKAYERLDQMGEKALLATTAAMLAQALYAQARLEEAERFCRASRQAAAAEDLSAQVTWRGVHAKILARHGRTADAETVARDAVALVAATDFLTYRGDAMLDLAEVLEVSGKPADAEAAIRAGLELYERKGNLVAAERARSRLGG